MYPPYYHHNNSCNLSLKPIVICNTSLLKFWLESLRYHPCKWIRAPACHPFLWKLIHPSYTLPYSSSLYTIIHNTSHTLHTKNPPWVDIPLFYMFFYNTKVVSKKITTIQFLPNQFSLLDSYFIFFYISRMFHTPYPPYTYNPPSVYFFL